MAETVSIQLNGEAVALAGVSSLAQLLEQRGLDPCTHATAVNGQFVAREARSAQVLQPGDAVTCFQAIVGG